MLHEKLDMDYAPRKIALPEEMEKKEYFLIVKHHIDTNHHVNNGQYVQMAMELLPDDFGFPRCVQSIKRQHFSVIWLCLIFI